MQTFLANLPLETEPSSPLLSAFLRQQTATLHEQIEHSLNLPSAIRNQADYVLWLDHFLGFYEPIERSLADFTGWDRSGFGQPAIAHHLSLMADLTAFGFDPNLSLRAAPALLPELPTFPHALGAYYVLEGATLGGRVILRDLDRRIGPAIAGATQFFGGRGDSVGPMWQTFRVAMDRYGHDHPRDYTDVVAGAQRTFRAMLAWFAPLCGVAARSS